MQRYCQEALKKILAVLSRTLCWSWLTCWSHSLCRCMPICNSTGIGGVLCQHHSVLYASHRLLDRERWCSTTELKCLATVWAINKFAWYLWGCKFALETDHKSLTYLQQSKLKNSQLIRWALALQEFHFHIVPISSVSNLAADILSRCDWPRIVSQVVVFFWM